MILGCILKFNLDRACCNLFVSLFARLRVVWHCCENAPVSQPTRLTQFIRLVFYRNGAQFPAPRPKSDGIEVHDRMFYSSTQVYEKFEHPGPTKK